MAEGTVKTAVTARKLRLGGSQTRRSQASDKVEELRKTVAEIHEALKLMVQQTALPWRSVVVPNPLIWYNPRAGACAPDVYLENVCSDVHMIEGKLKKIGALLQRPKKKLPVQAKKR